MGLNLPTYKKTWWILTKKKKHCQRKDASQNWKKKKKKEASFTAHLLIIFSHCENKRLTNYLTCTKCREVMSLLVRKLALFKFKCSRKMNNKWFFFFFVYSLV